MASTSKLSPHGRIYLFPRNEEEYEWVFLTYVLPQIDIEPSPETLKRIEDALSVLTPRQRAVFEMRVAALVSFATIGEYLDCSGASVRGTFIMAVEKIRLNLRRQREG